MKQLGYLVPILLLLGVGITSGLAAAEMTANQQVQPPTVTVGETATVTLTLTYNGANAMQVVVTPSLPSGVVTDLPGAQTAELYPGTSVPISYPIRAEQNGNYLITSLISYTEDGSPRELRMGSDFTATGGSVPGPTPDTPAMPPSTTPTPGSTPTPEVPGPSVPTGQEPTPEPTHTPEPIPTSSPSSPVPSSEPTSTPPGPVGPDGSGNSNTSMSH